MILDQVLGNYVTYIKEKCATIYNRIFESEYTEAELILVHLKSGDQNNIQLLINTIFPLLASHTHRQFVVFSPSAQEECRRLLPELALETSVNTLIRYFKDIALDFLKDEEENIWTNEIFSKFLHTNTEKYHQSLLLDADYKYNKSESKVKVVKFCINKKSGYDWFPPLWVTKANIKIEDFSIAQYEAPSDTSSWNDYCSYLKDPSTPASIRAPSPASIPAPSLASSVAASYLASSATASYPPAPSAASIRVPSPASSPASIPAFTAQGRPFTNPFQPFNSTGSPAGQASNAAASYPAPSTTGAPFNSLFSLKNPASSAGQALTRTPIPASSSAGQGRPFSFGVQASTSASSAAAPTLPFTRQGGSFSFGAQAPTLASSAAASSPASSPASVPASSPAPIGQGVTPLPFFNYPANAISDTIKRQIFDCEELWSDVYKQRIKNAPDYLRSKNIIPIELIRITSTELEQKVVTPISLKLKFDIISTLSLNQWVLIEDTFFYNDLKDFYTLYLTSSERLKLLVQVINGTTDFKTEVTLFPNDLIQIMNNQEEFEMIDFFNRMRDNMDRIQYLSSPQRSSLINACTLKKEFKLLTGTTNRRAYCYFFYAELQPSSSTVELHFVPSMSKNITLNVKLEEHRLKALHDRLSIRSRYSTSIFRSSVPYFQVKGQKENTYLEKPDSVPNPKLTFYTSNDLEQMSWGLVKYISDKIITSYGTEILSVQKLNIQALIRIIIIHTFYFTLLGDEQALASNKRACHKDIGAMINNVSRLNAELSQNSPQVVALKASFSQKLIGAINSIFGKNLGSHPDINSFISITFLKLFELVESQYTWRSQLMTVTPQMVFYSLQATKCSEKATDYFKGVDSRFINEQRSKNFGIACPAFIGSEKCRTGIEVIDFTSDDLRNIPGLNPIELLRYIQQSNEELTLMCEILSTDTLYQIAETPSSLPEFHNTDIALITSGLLTDHLIYPTVYKTLSDLDMDETFTTLKADKVDITRQFALVQPVADQKASISQGLSSKEAGIVISRPLQKNMLERLSKMKDEKKTKYSPEDISTMIENFTKNFMSSIEKKFDIKLERDFALSFDTLITHSGNGPNFIIFKIVFASEQLLSIRRPGVIDDLNLFIQDNLKSKQNKAFQLKGQLLTEAHKVCPKLYEAVENFGDWNITISHAFIVNEVKSLLGFFG